ncbi:PHP domain-containing protein [Methylomonas sp. AM2-LC]|uniref:PHP domain-containing protein n=1 Tax=Methylomonas sp. AM2-LC TaxID=3153301 RepID=UPI003262EBCB
MPEIYDLHTHSTASDGALSPQQLVSRAHAQGVSVMALTDHDTTAGLAEARQSAAQWGIRLINGIELSASYQSQCLHIVGLNIDPLQAELIAGTQKQQLLRTERAQKISAKLEKKHIPGAFAAVSLAAGNGEITRSHFADFLLANHYVSTQQEAFDRYLSKGKPAYVPTVWADLADVINWIKLAGGVAVLAHPMRYKLSAKWLRNALQAFKEMGGEGIEVVTGRASADEIRFSTDYAQKYQLYASVGSDFHAPDNPWLELGRLAALPPQLKPVWELF